MFSFFLRIFGLQKYLYFMENLSEYFLLLIVLVSVILKAIGKNKKPGKITQETTLPGKTAGEFIDESSFPRPFVNSYQEVVEEKPKKKTQRKPEVKPEKATAPISSAPIIIEPEEEGNSPFSFEEEEDVMRAIIYAEIINRKEY